MFLERSENIRDVLKYLRTFNDKTIVIHIDDEIINSALFLQHIKDISLIHQAGLKIVIVPGARETINKVLKNSAIDSSFHNGIRITTENAIPLIKMAAFDTANRVMTVLAGEHKTAIIGNWVKARGKGVLEGFDYAHSGEISDVDTFVIQKVLDTNCIPVFPCIGWSQTGKPYNISSVSLASEIAIALKAEKLLYIGNNTNICNNKFSLPKNIQLNENGTVWAMTIEQANDVLSENATVFESGSVCECTTMQLLKHCAKSCENGVSRSHILNGTIDGAVLQELFSDVGQGTMVYKNHYAGIRAMNIDDIDTVLNLMQPFIEKRIILPRSAEELLSTYNDYIVYEIDGDIKACCALHMYNDIESFVQAEIAGIVVDINYSGMGIGPKMIAYLLERAKRLNAKSIFILTTQTADWFESLGFTEDTVESLPVKRKQLWDQKRNSKLFRLSF